MTTTTKRIPPHSADAEASLLGAILLRPHALDDCGALAAEDFYDPRNGHVFRALRELQAKSRPTDVITLAEQLTASGQLEAIGGVSRVADLVAGVATAANAGHYAALVAAKARVRAAMEIAGQLLDEGYGDPDPAAYLERFQSAAFAACAPASTDTQAPLKRYVRDAVKAIDIRAGHAGEVTGIPTGFANLDRMTAGWQGGDMVILAARPSVGKSALAMALATHAAGLDFPVLFYSLEMSGASLAERALAADARVDAQALRLGRIDRATGGRLQLSGRRLAGLPLAIDEGSALSVVEIRARARRWRARNRGKVGLVVVDYLQLAHAPVPRGASREQEVSEISRGLKALAKETGCCVLALSQLNRGVEERPKGDRRPRLSDLRESGSLEQDADVVLMLYREELYQPTPENRGVVEVGIAKQRNGPTGVVGLKFDPTCVHFAASSRRDEC